jgi:hypothetical protein
MRPSRPGVGVGIHPTVKGMPAAEAPTERGLGTLAKAITDMQPVRYVPRPDPYSEQAEGASEPSGLSANIGTAQQATKLAKQGVGLAKVAFGGAPSHERPSEDAWQGYRAGERASAFSSFMPAFTPFPSEPMNYTPFIDGTRDDMFTPIPEGALDNGSGFMPTPMAPSVPGGAKVLPASGLEGALDNVGTGLNFASGLGTIARHAAGEGSDVSKGLGTLSGAIQAYGALAPKVGLPGIPYASPIAGVLSAAAGAADAPNPGAGILKGAGDFLMSAGPGMLVNMLPATGAASAAGVMGATTSTGAALSGSALGAGLGGLGLFLAPAVGGLVTALTNMFGLDDKSHTQREKEETARVLGRARKLLDEINMAATPEELERVLLRYQNRPNDQIAGFTSMEEILADPNRYTADILAGVKPERLAEAEAALTNAVRQSLAILRAAKAGNPEAQAMLGERQRYWNAVEPAARLAGGISQRLDTGEGGVIMQPGSAYSPETFSGPVPGMDGWTGRDLFIDQLPAGRGVIGGIADRIAAGRPEFGMNPMERMDAAGIRTPSDYVYEVALTQPELLDEYSADQIIEALRSLSKREAPPVSEASHGAVSYVPANLGDLRKTIEEMERRKAADLAWRNIPTP